MILKNNFFLVENKCCFCKNYGKCEKTEKLNLSKRKKKKLFGVRTKLLYYKIFQEYLLATEMKKNWKYL